MERKAEPAADPVVEGDVERGLGGGVAGGEGVDGGQDLLAAEGIGEVTEQRGDAVEEGGGAGLGLLALLHGDLRGFDPSNVPAKAWGAVAYLIIAGSIIGYSTFAWLMRHSTPARVATYAYVNPLVAVILGWLILGEPVTSRVLLAAVLVVAAVVLITIERTRAPADGR